jgi:hypothetical protein
MVYLDLVLRHFVHKRIYHLLVPMPYQHRTNGFGLLDRSNMSLVLLW